MTGLRSPRNRIRRPTLGALFLLLLPPTTGSLRAAEAPAYRLRLTKTKSRAPWDGRKVGVVGFHHAGLARPEGSDVTVSDAGGLLKHRVLQAGPGTFLRVAFEYRDPDDVTVAFGATPNPARDRPPPAPGESPYYAPPPVPLPPSEENAWEPTAGLLLTTFPLPEGVRADDWQDMRRTLAAARKLGLYGRDFTDAVYHGYHPFSDADKFVSVYEGWIGIPEDGDYTFCTSSDDASFLLVDGKVVVSWPGAHGAVGDTRFKKKITLAKGVHRFAYHHVNFGGPTIACAAWQGPSWDRIVPIAPESFAPVARFTADLPPRKGGNPSVWTTFGYAGESYIQGHPLIAYRFSLSTTVNIKRDLFWYFGDGCSEGPSDAFERTHIYLRPNLVPFRLRYGGTALVNLVHIHPDYSRRIDKQPDEPGPYLDAIAGYPFESLHEPDLTAAIDVLATDAKYADAVLRACHALLSREDADPKRAFDAALLLGERLRQGGKPEEAVAVYRAATEREGMGRYRTARLLRQVGDTYFYYLNDIDAALNEYDKVVGRYADVLEANIVRVTKIKIGDIFRQRGDGAKARRLYTEAEALKIGEERTFAQNTVRKGALYKAADDFLKRGEIETARKWLEILEWEYPMEKLDGYSSLVRARIAKKEGNLHEARKQLGWFVAAAPQSAYAAEALFRLAEFQREAGENETFARTAARLVREYPESPYADRVRALQP